MYNIKIISIVLLYYSLLFICCCATNGGQGRGRFSNNKFYKKKHETFKMFYLTKEGWVRRGGKGEEGCGKIFL